MLLNILLFSFCLTVTGCSSVRTVNKVNSTSKQDPVVKDDGDSWRTPNPCPAASGSTAGNRYRNDHLRDETPKAAGINFYLKRKDPAVDHLNSLTVFDAILTLPDLVGLHDVTVEPNNHTVQELEAALNDAWTSSLVMPTMNNSSDSGNLLYVRIVSMLDSGQELTANGSAITRITYTIVVSNTSSLLTSARHSSLQHRRIPSPTKEVFTERLAANGLSIYNGKLFPSQSVFMSTRPGDLDRSAIKRQIVADYERNSPDRSCIESSDLDIRFADSWHSTAAQVPRFKPLYSVNCLIFTKNHTQIRWQSAPEERRTETVRYYSSRWHERSQPIKRPLHPALSFRMHTSAPVNLQDLKSLELTMSMLFQDKLGFSAGPVEIFIWNPDVDHASTIHFFVSLRHRGKYIDLDSRLFYAKSIYRYLENSTAKGEYHTYPVRLGVEPFINGTNIDPQAARFLQECENKNLLTQAQSYGDCRFTLQFMTKWPQSQLPSTERIVQHVRSAFSAANKLTLDSAYFNITFIDQQVLFRTLNGHMAFGLRFSFSYSQLTNGKFWNMWRMPFYNIKEKIADDEATSSFLPLQQSLSFRLYTSVPISIQYLQRFAEYLQDKIDVYDFGSLVPWNPDINGTGRFDFFAVSKGKILKPSIISPESYGGEQIYDSLTKAGARFNFLDTSHNRPHISGSSRYIYICIYIYIDSSIRAPRGIVLSRQPFSGGQPAPGKENSALVSCVGSSSDNFTPCLLPRTFTLLIQKMRAENKDTDLGTDDLLRAVGNAFTEANPAVIDNVELSVTLTDRNDDFQTFRGDYVTKMEFTLTYPEMESGTYSKLWKYPNEAVIKRHLTKASANLVTLPFY